MRKCARISHDALRGAVQPPLGLVQMLNKKQREFFYHALHLIKTSDKPFFAFLSGSGGVGKSHLIKSIYQAALKYYNARVGEDFRRTQILLAPTGKAAYLIKGNTIHSALAIAPSQSLKNYKPLDSGRLNSLRCEFGALKLILFHHWSLVATESCDKMRKRANRKISCARSLWRSEVKKPE